MFTCGVQNPLKKTGRNLKPYEGNKIDTMKNYFSSFTCLLIFLGIAIALNSCNSENSKLETLKSLSAQGSRLIKNLKFDSAKIIIDSMKVIGADTSYIKSMEATLQSKKNFIFEAQGTYVHSKAGVKVVIKLRPKYIAGLSAYLNGQSINGITSKGKYVFVNDTLINIEWKNKAFNKTMGELVYNATNKTVKISNGTLYKKSNQNINSGGNSLSTAATSRTPKAKRFVMFCGEQYEYYEGINFRNSIPPGSQDRIGYASFRMYKEALDDLNYVGFNNAGILFEGTGNISGKKHTFLLMCDGTIY